MSRYGIPYNGSKSKIAEEILYQLPCGERLVDLFGGGFDHKEFFKWAKEQPYTVYYSSYTKGTVLWQKRVRSVMNSSSGAVYRNEALLMI